MKKDKSDLTGHEVIYYISASLVVALIVGVFVFSWVKLGVTQELIDWLRSFVSVEIGAEL
jgi:hypothetical protein